ncbi:type I polyketide synthase [Actinoplanes sp. N902-109]|uniref:type I polyketide synthase n=1 Tax=Actinoplanes sp. (strain N902-109) TaxID=649831 RepID=UPI00032941BC|nr:type I polyketide synthase [Actinoplanes sp. N902-109]AGL16004.1 polyketide synthase type I [Actinoplanes sp. N902-109]
MENQEKLLDYLKKAAAELQETRKRLRKLEAGTDEPLAIVGMSCRFPGGAATPEQFWELLAGGGDGIGGFPTDRGWDLDSLYDPDGGDGTSYVREGGFLAEAAEFDPGFFGISPREALAMDPQQRLLLEVSWEALERSGIDPATLRGSSTGVFAGGFNSLYQLGVMLATQTPGSNVAGVEGHLLTGNATSVLSGRVSYALGLEGPAVTVDTACSSSLVALHLAVQALRSGECSLALAGGVTVLATPSTFVDFSRQQGLSNDGRCRAFSAEASGTGWAEGVGVLVVERLADAQRNGHKVLAVVRGTAVNQDGASNGLTAPNGPSQQRVIRAALENAKLAAADVDVVEAHGTGTTLGDPIEAQALLATYGQDRDVPLWLGSVKSNIGHTQAAAGVAGLIKMILALQHEELPQTLYASQPSPHVDWSAGAVQLLTESVSWPAGQRVRRAGVSSFGMSGTNAHIILEEAPVIEPVAVEQTVPVVSGACAWVLSGRSADGLAGQAGRLREWLVARPELDATDVAWSLAATRSVFDHRAVVIGGDRDELINVATGQASAAVVSGEAPVEPRTVFVFPGQGSQWIGMGRDLASVSPVFAARFAECQQALAPYVRVDLSESTHDQVDVIQPLLWAVMVSLAAVWEAAGVTPDAVVGHSQGEIAAATVAGMLSLDDAAKVVALRSRTLRALSGAGGMMSIVAPLAAVEQRVARFSDRISVAAVNGPSAVIVSGEPAALEELKAELDAEDIRARMVNVDYASHGPQVDQLEAEILAALDGIEPVEGRVPMVSAMSGDTLSGPELDAAYWFASLRNPVHFERAVRTLGEQGHDMFIEVSPHPVMIGALSDTVDAPVLGTLRRDDGGTTRMVTSLAEAFVRGARVDWTRVLTTGHQVDLPTYAFQHQRFWPEALLALPAAGTFTSIGSAAEARFWAAVDGGDLTQLAETLAVDGNRPFYEILPALASWRREEQDRSVTAGWRYRVTWKPVTESGPGVLSGTYLVVTPAGHDSQDVLAALTARGADVVTVELPADAVERADIAAVLSATVAGDDGDETSPATFAGVISLLAFDESALPELPVVTRGLAATLGLVQALGDLAVAAPLWLATRGAVAADDMLSSPLQAQVWGLGRVVSYEQPDRWGGLIDLPAVLDDRAAARLAAVLAGCDEDEVAIRPAAILARRMVHAPQPRGQEWRPRGSVLITGGAGAIGGHVARRLAADNAGRLVLTGRTGPGTSGAAGLAADLATAGARVDVLSCDVGDRAELAGLLDWAGDVSAVLHTAGVIDDGVVDHLSPARLATVMAGKVAGAALLDELTADLDLEAFVLFSSGAATLGSAGQGNYAAANAYLDALAENRRARGLSALSVAWGQWSGGGLAESKDVIVQRAQRTPMPPMNPDLAVRALFEALQGDDSALTVMDVDWERLAGMAPGSGGLRNRPLVRDLPEIRALAAAPAPVRPTEQGGLAGRLSGLSRSEQEHLLTDIVRAEAALVLGHASADAVSATTAFKDMGIDSLTAVELRNGINAATGLRLPATLVFDHPNALAVAALLRTELVGAAAAAPTAQLPAVLAPTDEPLAIVGMACRFPGGVTSPGEFWQLLTDGTDAIGPFPGDRGWDVDGLYDPESERVGTSYVGAGGFLRDASGFDAGFFGISPREALTMDPQQRLLLEVCWEALERAGIDPASLRGTLTGTFVGGYDSGYMDVSLERSGENDEVAGHLMTGNATSILSGRVSYTLGLEGPAVTVDTGCSSALVALHLAAQALHRGECSLALAGGVTVMASSGGFVAFSQQRGLANDGRSKAFSADADGMGMAEGVGMIAVERLSDAQRNGHPVLAVIRGSAINQDGASNGLTAPNGPSQQRVIRAALAGAQLGTADIDAVEAHGTGTKLGDPIEAQALLATYGQDRPEGRPLWLGSVKSNIGHTGAAAGAAGLMKMVLALQNQQLPRTLHASNPTPHVDWTAGEVELLQEPRAWPVSERVRRAGVSAFGISGTNAHVILEEAPVVAAAPEQATDPVVAGACPWVISARSAEGLTAQLDRLREAAYAQDDTDVAWSLATTRSVFEHRAVAVDGDLSELITGVARPQSRTVFVFPGQGSQWIGMGRELASVSPVFAARFAECRQALAPYVDVDLTASEHDQVDVIQPLLWAVMVSLAAVWEAAGVHPDAVVGHSQGEIAAATVAGMLSLDDAAKVVALRSQTLRSLSGAGGMMSVVASVAEVEERIARFRSETPERITVAAVNGPKAVVVSGDPAALEELKAELDAAGVRARMVNVDYASHGPQVDRLQREILAVLDGIVPQQGRVPMVSAMSGETVSGPELDENYWYASLRNPVQFEPAVRILAASHDMFIEVTPHPVMLGALTDTLTEVAAEAGLGATPGAVCATLRRDDGGVTRLVTSLAEAFVQGARVDWTTVLTPGRRVDLPTYAFQRESYWPKGNPVTAGGDPVSLGLGAINHPLLSAAVELAGGAGLVCTGRLALRTQPWLGDHAVGGVVLLPSTGFVELAVQAGDQVGCGVLQELTLQAPLVLPADGGVQVQVVLGAADDAGCREVEVFSRADDAPGWVRNASGVVAPASTAAPVEDDLREWPPRNAEPVDVSDLYTVHLAEVYGPAFHGMRAAWKRGGDIFAEVTLPADPARDAAAFGLHPALLDAALHGSVLLGTDDGAEAPGLSMPFAWNDVELYATGAATLRVRLRRDARGGLVVTAADTSGAVVVSVGSLKHRPVTLDQIRAADNALADSLFVQEWTPVPAGATRAGDWALLGADRFGLADGLAAAGVAVRAFADLAELAAAVEAGDIDPRTVLVSPTAAGGDTDVPATVRDTTAEALTLVQQWLLESRLDAAQLTVVTSGAIAATSQEAVSDLAAAAAWGLLRAAQTENPDRLLLVDLPVTAPGTHAGLLPTVLDGSEPELVIRDTGAYGRRLVRVPGTLTPVEWPEQGEPGTRTVLVTGGTGTLGALTAKHFVATGRAGAAVLIGRAGPAAPDAAQLAAELAGLGAVVRIVACDAADRDALAAVLARIPAEFPLGSIVHSAGVVDDGIVAALTPERVATVLRPKVDAAWNLHELTAGLDLERFVSYSSAAVAFGAPGQSSYVAANSFLDALAGYRRAAGLPGMSLELGPWVHDAGIGRNLDERSLSRINQSFIPLGAEDGLVVLDVALDRDEAVLIPARLDAAALRSRAARSTDVPPMWRTLAGVSARRTAVSGGGADPAGGPGDALRRRLASVSGTERGRVLLDLVATNVAAVLGYANADAIEAGRAFTDLGFDSLTAVDLRNRLSVATGLRLPATLVFDYPTPAALAGQLRSELTGDLPAGAATVTPTAAPADEPIAIVGIGCRFPGDAVGPEELWELLASGTDAIGPFPRDRGWDLGSLYATEAGSTEAAYDQAGGFVRDASGFDAGFFGISPREALAMDPQQRILLETSWEALERSGIDPASLRGTATGAFIGGSGSGYGLGVELEAAGVAESHLLTGTAASVLSGRLSYTLGLEGPAVTVDTACSSSLVALHMACQALRAGEISLALVGGVVVSTTPVVFTAFNEAGGVSQSGRCKSFDASADGSGFAEGAGMVVVERLSDARRNGHKVLAVVRGSAMNQDGASNGLTAPNGPSQQRVIRAALANAGVRPDEVDVVEAHGSATLLGDPIEAQALIATYGQERPEGRPLWLGSVKSNIGHTQVAAGAAGIIKMVLALQHELMPQTLHVDQPTPQVDWSAGEVRLLTEAKPWPVGDRVRRAGVSAFGMSGTNVHVILEEPPAGEVVEQEPAEPPVPVLTGACAWLLSGRTDAGLTAQAQRLHAWIEARPGIDPAQVAWSLAATRSAFERRAVVVGDDLLTGLRSLGDGAPDASVVSGVTRSGGRTAFVFAGQGTHWIGMGRELLDASPVFAERFAECRRALAPYVDVSLDSGAEAAEELQPLLWAVMVSLAAVWEAAGVTPDAVVGHSQGEIAAATVAGILSLEDGARVVSARSRALSSLAMSGSMVSVVMPAQAVQELAGQWGERLSIAAVNSPAAAVVSGEPEALAEFERALAKQHVMRWRIPETDFVAHSPAVEPLAAVLAAELAGITPQAGRVPMVSTVTGDWISGTETGPAYWFANLRRTVRFEQAVRVLIAGGYGSFVEVSPHPVLTTAVGQTAEDAGATDILTVGTLERDNGGVHRMVTSLAQAYAGGLAVDWKAVLPSTDWVELPTYAFQHQPYWLSMNLGPAPAATAPAPGTAAEAQFWAAVEGGDLAHLADTLALNDLQQLSSVVPALASWRRREQDRSATTAWRYRIAWAPITVPGARLSGQWLVLRPGPAADTAVEEVVTALTARGAECVVVEVPAGTIERADMAALLGRTLRDAGAGTPAGVISLLALDEEMLTGLPSVTGGIAGTLALVQGLGDIGIDAPLWLFTRGAVAAAPGEVLSNPLQAQTWGFGRVVALEHPDRWGGLIDLPAVLDERTGAQLAAVLAARDENQVVIRPAGAMARRLSHAPQPPARDQWQPLHASALVTGGTGALAGHVEHWLAEGGAHRLVLTSRSGPGARGVAAQAAALAGKGTRVDVATCDGSDRAAVAGVLDWADRTGPKLTAVVHTAGVIDDGVIDRLAAPRLESVLAPKAASAAILDELTADLDLDAFVLFSSVVATTGGPGQSNYAAANAYLDAVAENRRSRGLPALSVAWGPWDGDGVARSNEAARQRLDRNEWESTMDPGLAVRALGEALDGADTTLTVTNIDWSLILSEPHKASQLLRAQMMRDLPEIHQLAAAVTDTVTVPEGDLARRLTALTRPEQLRLMTDLVRATAAKNLGHQSADDIEVGRAFSELGFDSLTAVEMRNDLMNATELRLSATLLFDYPNSAVLGEFLLTELLGAAPEQAVTAAVPAVADETIAIVGMACRFPGGVNGPDTLWDLLSSGGDAISGFPTDRDWDVEALKGTSYVDQGGFIDDMSGFDADFFGISPREALAMDPQQRLLLQVCWEALEHSGVAPDSLRGSATGVFAGGYASGYGYGAEFDGAAHLLTGNATSILSGRVSYALGLEGPAVTVDTACSSSLVALHLAAQALRTGECSMALAGGISILVSPESFVGFSEQSGLAHDGRCKAFSAQADGMGFAEGVGMVVVERLADAQRNGHKVLAVLRGSAVNQDGASNGLTAPNGPSQQRVIRAALANAGLRADEIDVVEAHGTGTKLGDPIEAQALLATYGRQRPQDRPLLLGSVKSNIGHTQAAAGAASVIKMVLALQHKHLPKTLHADEVSPHVDWSAGEVRLLQEGRDWRSDGQPRRAGVSSFGLSGTNAHLILEEAPETEPVVGTDEPADPVVQGACAWVVSGRTASALTAQVERLRERVDGLDPADVAWSLATTRTVFEHRAVAVGGDLDNLVTGVARPQTRPVFVFPGQGSQWIGMGRELAAASPVFAERFSECQFALSPYVNVSLNSPDLDAVDVVQPLLWAVMVSLAAVWEAAGVTPDAVVGHSQGEIAAATVAGMLSLEDAAKVVALRSQTLRALSGAGGMMSVQQPVALVEERLAACAGRVEIAAVNGPSAVIVSGAPEALAALKESLDADGVRARMVAVDYASHCAQIDQLHDEILEVLRGITPRQGRVPMVSAMSGETLTGVELDAEYWYASLRNPVYFERAVRTLAGQGHDLFIEVTPHPVMLGALTDTLDESAAVCVTLRRDDGGVDRLVTSLAEAYVRGARVDWTTVLTAGQRVDLPTYAFQTERFWPKLAAPGGPADAGSLGLGAVDHPLLGAAVELAGGAGVVCTGRLSVRTHPWLADHAVGGTILVPGTGFVEMVVRAGDQAGCGSLEELTLQAPLVLPAGGGGVQVQVVVGAADEAGRRGIEVFSRPDEPGTQHAWTQHAGGTVAPATETPAPDADLTVWPPHAATAVDIDGMYEALSGVYGYGPAFQGLRKVWRRDGDVFAEVALPETVAGDAQAFGLHPALLDAVLHASALVAGPHDDEPGQARLPFAWTGVQLHAAGASVLRARLRRDAEGALTLSAADATGAPVVSVASLITRPVAMQQSQPQATDALFAVDWTPVAPAAGIGELVLLGEDRFGLGLTAGDIPDTGAAVVCVKPIGEMLEFVQEWLAEERVPLVVLTRGAVPVFAGEGVPDLDAAATWGLLRSAQTENPDRIVLIDLPVTGTVDPALLSTLVTAGEPELAVRAGTAYGRRLGRPSGELALPAGTSWKLTPDAGGSLDGLAAVEVEQRSLQAGEVRVAVRSAGLNFRDVLIALGMYPGEGGMGTEIAGEILEVGAGVTALQPGDRVMGIAEGGFGPTVVADARQLVAVPAGWSFTTAASVPVAFLTAWYALVHLAEARPGQRVLIHAAAGGVGSAAVQIAQHLGLEVYATASPAKWPALTAAGLAADHIASSRDAGFATTFPAVDIVVNSLAGELTDASLRLVAPGGTFVEMGLTDLRDPAQTAGITYRPFVLAEGGPEQLGAMLRQIVGLLAAGDLTVLPVRAWDVRRAREAFRYMSQARHTGKLVFTLPSPVRAGAAPSAAGAVLITGGTGTLGALVARHYAGTGRASRLILTSRSGLGAPGAADLVASLGVPAEVVACDAADRDALAALLDRIPDLSGVVHTAGVLDDGVIASLTRERVDAVLRPKVDGARNLHELTRHRTIDEFVLFSSAAATTSAAGQGNYVAANAYLDALAAERRASGLPATSLAWGMWAEASALTGRLSDAERDRIAQGVSALSSQDGLALLDAALARDEAMLVPARFDLAGLRAQAAKAADASQIPALWRALLTAGGTRRTAAGAVAVSGKETLLQQLSGLAGTDRIKVLSDLIRTNVASVLGHATTGTIEANRNFTDLGFDSLTAVELRNRLNTATGLRLPATLVFDYPNVAELAEFLRERLLPEIGEEADPAETELRKVLATLPMAKFREAGLMDALLQLAGIRGGTADTGGDSVEAIDDLDADDLIRLALDSETD